MSFIPCTSDCKYQSDGSCSLEKAVCGGIASDSGCIHYVPKETSKYSKNEIKKENPHTFKCVWIHK